MPIPDTANISTVRPRLIHPVVKYGPEGRDSTLDLIKKVPDIDIYGFLLTRDVKHPLSTMISERWYELHDITGPNFLLLAFNPPYEWKGFFKKHWKGTLGDEFEDVWEEWQNGVAPAAAINYCNLFEPEIKLSQFPCLVLFTDLDDLKEQQAVIRSLPDWDADSLYDFFCGMVESIKGCSKQPKEIRLECLRNSLTSPKAKISAHYKHTKAKAMEFMKKNPSKIVGLTVNFISGLGGVNIMPINIKIDMSRIKK